MSTVAKIHTIGATTTCPFPIPDRVWEVFQGKGIRTVFVSIGASASALPDLEIAESLGCPVHAVPLSAAEKATWSEVATILKDRKRDEATANPFSAGAETKWILPKNIRIQEKLPWWARGTVDLSGVGPVVTETALSMVEQICKDAKVKGGEVRLDILKVDTVDAAAGLEIPLLSSILNAGLRPALILVNWSRMPDQDLMITCAAGHLQNSGYRLYAKNGSRFLYHFTDNDMYQICSWENDAVANPMVHEIISSTKEQLLAPPRVVAAVAAAAAKDKKPEAPSEEATGC
jgi:hypothetical protein